MKKYEAVSPEIRLPDSEPRGLRSTGSSGSGGTARPAIVLTVISPWNPRALDKVPGDMRNGGLALGLDDLSVTEGKV